MSNLLGKVHAFANSKFASRLLLLAFFYAIAAASYSGFMGKYALRDDSEIYSLAQMVDKTAEKPFVYRQLLPTTAKWIQNKASDPDSELFVIANKFNLDASKTFSRATASNQDGYQYAYRFVCLTYFFALLVSLYLLRSLLLKFGYNHFEAVLAPTAFIITLPYIQSTAGYLYDSAELAFFAAVVLLVINQKYFMFMLFTALATFNKESFLFFIPALYPFISEKNNWQKTLLILGAAMLISGLIHLYLAAQFQGSVGGSEAYIQILSNLTAYLNPKTYLGDETTYGLPGPRGFFITTVMMMVIIAIRGSQQVHDIWKKHFLIAAAINLPLFLLFCVTGELRNLSLLFIGTVVFLAGAIKATYTEASEMA